MMLNGDVNEKENTTKGGLTANLTNQFDYQWWSRHSYHCFLAFVKAFDKLVIVIPPRLWVDVIYEHKYLLGTSQPQPNFEKGPTFCRGIIDSMIHVLI